jgi:hypothetical protein
MLVRLSFLVLSIFFFMQMPSGYAESDWRMFEGRPIGLVKVPDLIDCHFLDKCRPVRFPVRDKPDSERQPHFIEFFRQLRFMEYGLVNDSGSLVYKQEGDWFMLRLNTETGERYWVHKKQTSAYYPLENILTKYPLMLITSLWDGALRDSPDMSSSIRRWLWEPYILGYVTLDNPRSVKGPEKSVTTHFRDKDGRLQPTEAKEWRTSIENVIKYSVKSSPNESATELFEFTNTSPISEVHTSQGAGGYSCQGQQGECDRVAERAGQVLIFEQRGDWLKIKGAEQPPQNGAFGWIKKSKHISALKPMSDPKLRNEVMARIYGKSLHLTIGGDDRIGARALKIERRGAQLWAYVEIDGQQCKAKTDWKKVGGWVPVYSPGGDLQMFFNIFCENQ